MKNLKGVSSKFLAALLWAGLSFGGAASAAEPPSARARVEQSIQQFCAAGPLAGGCLLGGLERVQLSGDVYEYSFRLKVGAGEHDVIGLHRVVRETAPWVALGTSKSVFLVHGDAWGFDGVFKPVATFLAQGNVDVWGIDQRWVNVPAGTADFTFMKDWNLGTHAKDVRTGLAVARIVRWLSGEGGRMNLLGWSRGAVVSYIAAGMETQLPPPLRHVGGFIPVDMALKFAPGDAALTQAACGRYQQAAAAFAAGQYEGGMTGPAPGVLVQLVGALAANAPSGTSPINPPLTNRQLALALAEATFSTGVAPVPTYHFTGGQFDAATGLPTGLSWTQEGTLFSFLQRAVPYQDFREVMETEALTCGAENGAPDLAYDDHLADITVPVLYVGAAGGFGVQGLNTVALLGSTDKTTRLVQRLPAEARVMDYGHADLFIADDARDQVWTPVLNWLQAH